MQGVIKTDGMPTRVWVSMGVTINRGNFESVKVDAGCAMDVEEGVTIRTTFARAWKITKGELRRQVGSDAPVFRTDKDE